MRYEFFRVDYLTKPYKMAELLLRIKALLRRSKPRGNTANPVSINGFEVQWRHHKIIKKENHIHLTKKEFDLLKLLFDNIDQPLSRDHILNQVWGSEIYVEERTVDNFISKIRKTLELQEPNEYFIKTVRSIGYVLMKNGSFQKSPEF